MYDDVCGLAEESVLKMFSSMWRGFFGETKQKFVNKSLNVYETTLSECKIM